MNCYLIAAALLLPALKRLERQRYNYTRGKLMKRLSSSLRGNEVYTRLTRVYTRCFTTRQVKFMVSIHHLWSYVLTGGAWCVFLFTMRDG
jgi:hypothetical protein